MNRQSSKISQTEDPSVTSPETEPEHLVIPSREILGGPTTGQIESTASLELDPTPDDSLRPPTAPPLQPISKDVGKSKITTNESPAAIKANDGEAIAVKVNPHTETTPKLEEPLPAKQTTAPEATPAATPEAKTTAQKPMPAEEQVIDPKRQREIDSFIKSRQYYVPIDSVARKRSIKVSLGLALLVILLALILLDLLIDTGAILLVQRIPHTHFFSNSLNN